MLQLAAIRVSGPSRAELVLQALTTVEALALDELLRALPRLAAFAAALDTDGDLHFLVESTTLHFLDSESAGLGAHWSDFGLGRWMFALEAQGNVLALSMATGYGHDLNEVQLVTATGSHPAPPISRATVSAPRRGCSPVRCATSPSTSSSWTRPGSSRR